MRGRFEQFEHTADVGVRIWGRDLLDLFRNSVEAMLSLIVDLDTVKEERTLSVLAEGKDHSELFFNWLDELLYLHNTRYFLCKSVEDINIQNNRVEAHIRGERVDPERHVLRAELKAVTYHQFEVKRIGSCWEARVIFDV